MCPCAPNAHRLTIDRSVGRLGMAQADKFRRMGDTTAQGLGGTRRKYAAPTLSERCKKYWRWARRESSEY